MEERKEQARKEQEEYIKNLPDPDQPPGHRKLPDDERQKTLALLQESMALIKFFIVFFFYFNDHFLCN